jgi:hypothetical protein
MELAIFWLVTLCLNQLRFGVPLYLAIMVSNIERMQNEGFKIRVQIDIFPENGNTRRQLGYRCKI